MPSSAHRTIFWLTFTTILLGSGLSAHDLWLEAGSGGYLLRYGHIQPQGADEIALQIDLRKITEPICVTTASRTKLAFTARGGTAFAPGDCEAILLEYRGGNYTKTVEGTLPLPRNQTKNPLRSWISFEYLKSIQRWTDASRRPLGAPLELTPVTEPARWQVGEKITLLVTAGGKPQSGIVVAVHDDPRGVTDSGGMVNVRIREKGIQIFQATRKIALNRPDADEEIHTALLQFEVTR